MSNLTDNLIRMKEKIETAKTKKATLEGKLESLMDNLKDDFDCDSFEDASKKMEKLGNEIDQEEQELNDEIEKLQESFDWE